MMLFRRCTLAAVLAACLTNPLTANSANSDDWWFDVEVVAFKRNMALTELEEQFDLAESFAIPASEADVISAVIMPDIRFIKQNLATCDINGQPEKAALPAWPKDLGLLVPAYDTNFVAFNSSNLLNEPSQFNDSNTVESTESLEASGNADDYSAVLSNNDKSRDVESSSYQNSGYENSRYGNSDFAQSGEASQSPSSPSLEAIASYWTRVNWTDFFGAHSEPTVSMPQFAYCETQKPWLSVKQQPDGFKWQRHSVDYSMPAPDQLPVVIEGHDWPLASTSHLLSSDMQELTSISRQIRSNRQLERLLHVTWRQPVEFGKNKAFNVRLFGGTNYASRFNQAGEQIKDNPATADDTFTSEEQVTVSVLNEDEQTADIRSGFFTSLEQRLSQPEPVSFKTLQRLGTEGNLSDKTANTSNAFREPIWEIDGRMKVFLKYINRVPYLHIDSEMFYRHQVPTQYFTDINGASELTSSQSGTLLNDNADSSVLETGAQTVEYQLVSIPLAEQRRVISNQLHYFDHPLYGFIVQIRRYKRPLQADTNK